MLCADVSCEIRGAGGGSLAAGCVKPEDLFPGDDLRRAVSRATFLERRKLLLLICLYVEDKTTGGLKTEISVRLRQCCRAGRERHTAGNN